MTIFILLTLLLLFAKVLCGDSTVTCTVSSTNSFSYICKPADISATIKSTSEYTVTATNIGCA